MIDWIERRLLTAHEAKRAVYVDFEGRADQPPFLMGALWADGPNGLFQQLVVDDRLPWRMPGLESAPLVTTSLPEAITQLATKASAENRVIASWSQHELDVFRSIGDLPATAPSPSVMYCNCIRTAKVWKDRAHPNVDFPVTIGRGRNQLSRYLELIDYAVPRNLGQQQTGQRLEATIKQLEAKHLNYALLTPVVKRKWISVLKHNRHDCHGLWRLMSSAAQ